MKPLPFNISKTTDKSIGVQHDILPYFYDRLHYHPEWQITLIVNSEGTLYAGDSMCRFGVGDLCFIGSNLPHLFRNDNKFYELAEEQAEAISIFFDRKSLGEGFFEIPELRVANQLLRQANKGLCFQAGSLELELKPFFERMKNQEGIALLQDFLSLLKCLCESQDAQTISSLAYDRSQAEAAGKRLDQVLQFIFQHYEQKITVEEAAQASNLSIPAFCRFFKLHTRKTFIAYVNEVRINAACQLLMEQQHSIGQIAYKVGFNNLSNFNRQFKRLKGMVPSSFQQHYQ
ncbi:MAG: AraC family transcriptional regulator [Saprospiraceae bacterium]|nr:AraC family transcriptional regulator [Saprospiraceae bacterium]